MPNNKTNSKPSAKDKEKPRMPIIELPPDEADVVPIKVRLTRKMWSELQECADFEDAIWRKARKGTVSRNDIVVHLLKWGIDQYWAEKGKPRPKK